MLSIIVPLYNEEPNLAPLYERLVAALEPLGRPFEAILVNDGQTAAMMAGIHYACGEIIIPMDGDLQNDPADVAKLLAKLEEGYDMVSGWRRDRKDDAVRRNFPSRLANLLISGISGVKLHDYGCWPRSSCAPTTSRRARRSTS